MGAREVISAILGWTYTLAWAGSFAPQIVLSYRRRSVSGLSIDFVTLNVVGFVCYSTYTCVLFASPTLRDDFARAHNGQLPSVQPNDVAFALWALLSTLVVAAQAVVYKREPSQRLSRPARELVLVLAAAVAAELYLAIRHQTPWLELISLLGAIKLVMTCVGNGRSVLTCSLAKYIPQAWLNYQRQSTVGWSVHQVLLDIVGGIASLTQLALIDRGINPPKLALAFIVLGFDSLFVVQHYVLYRDRGEERRRLLEEDAA